MGQQRSRRDEDANYRWAFRYVYKREPSQDELEEYKWARHIERLRSWPAHWLSPADIADLEAADAAKAAPPTEPLPAPVPAAKTDAPPTETGEHAADSQPKRRGRKRRESAALPPRRRMPERARALLREQLADGPKRRELIEAAAKAAEIPERSLIVAADALGVRTRRGEWWLPRQYYTA